MRFTLGKFEIIATGRLCCNMSYNKLEAFLGVSAPLSMTLECTLIILSTVNAIDSIMPKNVAKLQKKNPT